MTSSVSPIKPILSFSILAKLAVTDLIGPLGCDRQMVSFWLFNGWMCEINLKDLPNVPPGVPSEV